MILQEQIFLGSLAPLLTPNLEGLGLHLVWPLHFDLSGTGGATKSLCSRQHTSLGHWGAPARTALRVIGARQHSSSSRWGAQTTSPP
jgi:hypothetical protein